MDTQDNENKTSNAALPDNISAAEAQELAKKLFAGKNAPKKVVALAADMLAGQEISPLAQQGLLPPRPPKSTVPILRDDPGPKRRPKKYDWALAARLLADGCPTSIVAAQLGCSRNAVYHALRRSKGMRDWIRKEKWKHGIETGAFLKAHRQKLAHELIKQALAGNTRALCFLAKELNLASGDYGWI